MRKGGGKGKDIRREKKIDRGKNRERRRTGRGCEGGGTTLRVSGGPAPYFGQLARVREWSRAP